MRSNKSEKTQGKPRRNRAPIAAHPVFVPTLALWGGALAGLGVFVLPAGTIERHMPASLLAPIAGYSGFVLAGIAALVGSVALFLVAAAIRRAVIGGADHTEDDDGAATLETIDPSVDLGSDSLDAPIQDEQPDQFDDADHFDDDDQEAWWLDELDEVEPAQPEAALDLAEFSQTQPDPEPEPELPAPAPSQARLRAAPRIPSPTAVEKLRAVDPQDLSMVEMVERLALALQENRAAQRSHNRDAVLAEALKTLGQFTEQGFDQGNSAAARDDAQRDMRDALTRLQRLRGAA